MKSIKINEALHKQLKLKATQDSKTITEVAEMAIEKEVKG